MLNFVANKGHRSGGEFREDDMIQKLTRASRVHFHFYRHSCLLPAGGTNLLLAIVLFSTWPVAGVAAGPEACAEPGATSGASEGVKVYVDPDTGELLPGPPPGQPEPPGTASTAAEEPQYETETRPDGTVVLDLGGRPAEELRAEEVDGKTVLCHRTGSVPPVPPED